MAGGLLEAGALDAGGAALFNPSGNLEIRFRRSKSCVQLLYFAMFHFKVSIVLNRTSALKPPVDTNDT